MILDTMTKVLQVVLAEAKTTNDCPIVSCYADYNAGASTFGFGNQNINSNGTTAVAAVAAPPASVQRQVKELRLFNNDTVSHAVTLQLYDGTSTWIIAPAKLTVPPNGSFIYTPESGVSIFGSPIGGATTGTGNIVLQTAPVITAPIINGGTITGTIAGTPAIAIEGVANGGDASAGTIGEYLSATRLIGTAVALVANTSQDILALSLSAGDWDVAGNIVYAAAGGASLIGATGWISQASATLPTLPNNGGETIWSGTAPAVDNEVVLSIGPTRINVSSTTIIYLSANSQFSGGTAAGYGFIGARRSANSP